MKLIEVAINNIKIDSVTPSAELINSISLQGLVNPIRLTPVKDSNYAYTIVDGRRRITALIQKGIKTVKAIVEDGINAEKMAIHAITLNGGKPNPLDEGKHITYLVNELGYSAKDLAELTGFDITTVYNRIDLVEKLIPSLQEKIKKGIIPLTSSTELVKLSPDNQEYVLEKIESENLTKLKDIKNLVKEVRDSKVSVSIPILPGVPTDSKKGVFISYEEMETLLKGNTLNIEYGSKTYTIGVINGH